jgi:hypothetical protein
MPRATRLPAGRLCSGPARRASCVPEPARDGARRCRLGPPAQPARCSMRRAGSVPRFRPGRPMAPQRARQSRARPCAREPRDELGLLPCSIWSGTPSSGSGPLRCAAFGVRSTEAAPTLVGPTLSSVQSLRLTGRKSLARKPAAGRQILPHPLQALPAAPDAPSASRRENARQACRSQRRGPPGTAFASKGAEIRHATRGARPRANDRPGPRPGPARARAVPAADLARPRQLAPQGHRRLRGGARQPPGRLRPRRRPRRHRRLAAQLRLHRGKPEGDARAPRGQHTRPRSKDQEPRRGKWSRQRCRRSPARARASTLR